MQMAVSGEATGTGKSLMQSLWMIVFKGEVKTTISSITEAQAFKMLASGENIPGDPKKSIPLFGVSGETKVFAKQLNIHIFG